MSNQNQIMTCNLISTKTVVIEGDILNPGSNKFMVILPITVPNGPDWDKLNAETFSIKKVNIKIMPYYTEASLINTNVGPGYITGKHPVYVQFFAGNTFGEKDATNMNELIYTGSYTYGANLSSITAEFLGKTFKTILNDGTGNIFNKETILPDKFMDSYLLQSANNVLQFGHVAISIRPDDFKVDLSSYIPMTSTEFMRKELRTRKLAKNDEEEEEEESDKRTIKKVEKIDKKKKVTKKNPNPNPNPEPEPEPEPEPTPEPEPDDSSITPLGYEYLDKALNGKLIVKCPFFIITEVTLDYTKKAY